MFVPTALAKSQGGHVTPAHEVPRLEPFQRVVQRRESEPTLVDGPGRRLESAPEAAAATAASKEPIAAGHATRSEASNLVFP